MRKLALMAGVVLLSATGMMAQGVQGVHSDASPFQVGVGFSFVSFNETPSTTWNNAGLNASGVYYRDWLGVEADLTDVFGSQNSQSTQLLFAGGGIRMKIPTAWSFQPWVHALAGFSHVSPQPSFGGNSSPGYKLGGGIDFNPRRSRIGYRVSVDMLGTTFFKTYQLSPEVSVGIVLGLGKE